jgi:hypothetical protein
VFPLTTDEVQAVRLIVVSVCDPVGGVTESTAEITIDPVAAGEVPAAVSVAVMVVDPFAP